MSMGRLLQSNGPVFGQRVFLALNGVRHWVSNSDWIVENGFRWPESVSIVPVEELLALAPGRPASRKWDLDFGGSTRTEDALALREMGCSFAGGSGIEFGAASNPLPIPLSANVTYADMLSYEQLLESAYDGQTPEGMIQPHLRASLDKMGGLGTFDFVAAAHVIEHVRDPIGTIVRASTKIARGGHLVLFVPDMATTFDRDREVTPLSHLIEDFMSLDADRDAEHFKEFYSLAFPSPPDRYEEIWKEAWLSEFPIHYHCWTYDSFREMADWIIRSFGAYRDFWSHPTIGTEFCFVLRR